VLGLQWYQAGDLYVGSPSIVYLAFGLIWVGMRVREWHSARRMTPQGFRDMMRQAEETAAVQRAPVVYLKWLAGMIAVAGVAQLLASSSGAQEFGVLPGMMENSAIRGGEVWRLLTCGFLHAGLIHFGVNYMRSFRWAARRRCWRTARTCRSSSWRRWWPARSPASWCRRTTLRWARPAG
jgi:hypothetical protein